MILVDANVLLDVVTRDLNWMVWSLNQLRTAAMSQQLAINSIVYAELSPGYERPEEVDELVAGLGLDMLDIPRPALFLAGKVFLKYRARGGLKTGVLPDFFIGAHAAVSGLPLLTRDRARYATYFPEVQLIAPEQS